MKHYLTVLSILLAVLFSTLSSARIFNVPGDAGSIQRGLDYAGSGDTVLVGQGTWTGTNNKNLDFHGRAICLISASGSNTDTVIDCENDGRIAVLSNEVSYDDIVIRGFTFQNCNISDNHGAGLYIYHCSPTVENCSFYSCVTTGEFHSGGAILIGGSADPIIRNCMFYNCLSDAKGGGIYISTDSEPTIADCLFYYNHSKWGGAIMVDSSNAKIFSCTFSNNLADENGGAIRITNASPQIYNCLFFQNSATTLTGGAIWAYSASPEIVNCTFHNNSSGSAGGAIACTQSDSNPHVVNSILWGNNPDQINVSNASIYVEYSDVSGGWGSPADHNIQTDPLFTTGVDGTYYLSHIASGQSSDSPCNDAGSASASSICYSDVRDTVCMSERTTRTDLVTDSGTVDMGYHYPGAAAPTSTPIPPTSTPIPPTFTPSPSSTPRPTNTPVPPTSTPLPGILHVPSEYSTIQSAIDAANAGDTVLVADGTFTGTGNHNLDFWGKGITVMSEHGPHRCVVSAGAGNVGFLFHSGENTDSVLTGFGIQRGSADYGAGITIGQNSSPVISNCMLYNNTAAINGGAIFCSGGSAPIIINCEITANTCDTGSAIAISSASDPQIVSCTITENSGGSTGCVHISSLSNPEFSNCIIWNNAGDEIVVDNATPNFTYCDIDNGHTVYPGTGNINADPEFVTGDNGDYYLNYLAIKLISPCIDAGNTTSDSICLTPAHDLCLNALTTRTDNYPDIHTVDIGFHYMITVCENTGDVDGSGIVTSGDAQSAFLIALAMITPTPEEKCRADCDGSGVVTSGDAQAIFLKAIGSGTCSDPL